MHAVTPPNARLYRHTNDVVVIVIACVVRGTTRRRIIWNGVVDTGNNKTFYCDNKNSFSVDHIASNQTKTWEKEPILGGSYCGTIVATQLLELHQRSPNIMLQRAIFYYCQVRQNKEQKTRNEAQVKKAITVGSFTFLT